MFLIGKGGKKDLGEDPEKNMFIFVYGGKRKGGERRTLRPVSWHTAWQGSPEAGSSLLRRESHKSYIYIS